MTGMLFKTSGAALIAFLGFGLLPVTIPNSQLPDKENALLINRQECGCPCAEAVIVGGKLNIDSTIIKNYPTIQTTSMTVVNFPPFENITNDNYATFEFANGNSFRIHGKVIGIDTIYCDPPNCEIVPLFEVDDWTITTYHFKFWQFDKLLLFSYIGAWLFALPAYLVIAFRRNAEKKKRG